MRKCLNVLGVLGVVLFVDFLSVFMLALQLVFMSLETDKIEFPILILFTLALQLCTSFMVRSMHEGKIVEWIAKVLMLVPALFTTVLICLDLIFGNTIIADGGNAVVITAQILTICALSFVPLISYIRRKNLQFPAMSE